MEAVSRDYASEVVSTADVAKPAVLMVGNFLSMITGTRSVCEDLADRLAASGWMIITTSSQSERLVRLTDMVSTTWSRRHEYDVAQVDVFSGLAFFWAEAVSWTLRQAGKPCILTLHGGNLPAFARRWPWRVRSLLQSAAKVTTPSRYLFEQMHSYRDDLILIPNSIDLAAYPFRSRDAASPSLVWLRAFHDIYKPALAADVVQRLSNSFPNVRLAMIGPDKGDGSFRRFLQIAHQLDVHDHIEILGSVAKVDVPRLLGSHDIFLNTTRVDNMPVSVIEAMALGLCVVSTNVGGLPYLLEHDVDALLVQADDPEGMAAACQRILTEPGLAARLSHNARAKAENFDWSRILPQWERLLVDVIERRAQ